MNTYTWTKSILMAIAMIAAFSFFVYRVRHLVLLMLSVQGNTAFKLDRTEKVKRTTGILLEETIEELEQKRKAVEAQAKVIQTENERKTKELAEARRGHREGSG